MTDALGQLAPEVADYRCGDYELRHDLACAVRARDASIREATVFYAARVLEATSAAALDAMGLKGKDNAFSNLTRLGEYGVLTTHARYWAHALRRTGNGVRHARSRTSDAQQQTSLAFLEFWLRWYFCEFACGAHLAALTTDPAATVFIADAGLARTLSLVADDDADPGEVIGQVLAAGADATLRAPAVLAVLAERVIDAGRLAEADALLGQALADHGDDLRLLQLRGLVASRSGRLDEAVAVLEPLYRQYRTDDETIGIMAGVYKRKWRAEGDPAWLAKSHKAYEAGWKQDKDNVYLGINTASTFLLMGQDEQARDVAAEVRDVLLVRQEVLSAMGESGSPAALNLWDRLTLVEAQLVSRQADSAAEEFGRITAEYASSSGALTVACRQFIEVAERTGSDTAAYQSLLAQLTGERS